MTRPQYAIYPSGSSFCNVFPCGTAYTGPTDYYKKASQSLSEQHQMRSLQVPHLGHSAQTVDAGNYATADLVSALSVEGQCTIWDLAAMQAGLTSLDICSRQVLKKIAAQTLPGKKHSAAPGITSSLKFAATFPSIPESFKPSYTELLVHIWPKSQAQVSHGEESHQINSNMLLAQRLPTINTLLMHRLLANA